MPSSNFAEKYRAAIFRSSITLEQVISPLVSVIVPTYREAENLPLLIPRLCKALNRSGMTAEILVVDDNSPDETVAVCEKLKAEYPVQLMVRTTDRGLSPAVVHGLKHAQGSVLVVMDADLSHPPETVPDLVAAVLEQQGDFVIGSRYVTGGSTDDDWGFFRWLNSQVATWMSRGLTSAKDPMAGFFALSRQTFEQAEQLNPIGYKIGLELIVKCQCQQVAEIPIHFQDRLHGESKLSLKEQLNYLRHLGRLYRYKLGGWFTPLAFGLVGASGMLVDLLLLTVLMLGVSFPVARAFSIWGAMSWNYLGNRLLTFADRKREPVRRQYLKFCSSCLVGAVVSWAISTLAWQHFAAQLQTPQVAAMLGILGGVVLNYLLSNYVVFKKQEPNLQGFLGNSDGALQHSHENFPEAETVVKKKIKLSAVISGAVLLSVLALGLTSKTWFRAEIDGLDQAHNVLTSVYFHDLFQDRPVGDLVRYTYDYQRQYPALGLMFWPPLFHAVTGAAMLVTGPQIETVHIVLAGFVLLFALTMYFATAQELTVPGAVIAVALTLTTPVLFQLENSAMLELPSLAMAFVALWMYVRLTRRGEWTGYVEAVLAGICCVLIAYTKQPAIFVLGGIFLDVVFHHRHLLKASKTWICVGTAAVMLLPLMAFTLKFGQVNLAQSIGNQGNIYVEHHRVAERWSVEGWTYYLQLLPDQLPVLVLLMSGAGLLLIACRTELRKTTGLWLCCLVSWYLMFSYFDNKQVRFVAYAIPFLCIAAVISSRWLMQRQQAVGICSLLILGLFAARGTQLIADQQPRGYQGLETVLGQCLHEQNGNFAFFGEDHHLFTAQLRLMDPQCEHSLLRGKDLLVSENSSAAELSQLLHDYRVRWLLVDPELPAGQQLEQLVSERPYDFQLTQPAVHFDNGLKTFPLKVYKYQGVLAETMRVIPLHSSALGVVIE